MERLNQRLLIAQKALLTLAEMLDIEELSHIERDAMIQRFEYSFEAIWKTIKHYLNVVEGNDVASPKGVVRASFEVGLLDEEQTRQALQMTDDRNLTSHTYNEELAKQIVARIPQHYLILNHWLTTVSRNIKR